MMPLEREKGKQVKQTSLGCSEEKSAFRSKNDCRKMYADMVRVCVCVCVNFIDRKQSGLKINGVILLTEPNQANSTHRAEGAEATLQFAKGVFWSLIRLFCAFVL